jgi:hypothetical protein
MPTVVELLRRLMVAEYINLHDGMMYLYTAVKDGVITMEEKEAVERWLEEEK